MHFFTCINAGGKNTTVQCNNLIEHSKPQGISNPNTKVQPGHSKQLGFFSTGVWPRQSQEQMFAVWPLGIHKNKSQAIHKWP